MNKQEVMAKVALTEKDTGSPEVQVALLTAHINELLSLIHISEPTRH